MLLKVYVKEKHNLPEIINLIKMNSQSHAQAKFKSFYCTEFVIASVKGFRLLREMQECTTFLFHTRKDKEQ